MSFGGRREACALACGRGLCLPSALCSGAFDGRDGGNCVAVATVEGSLFVCKEQRPWAEVHGLGVVQCMCTVTMGSFDVLVCVTSTCAFVVDLRGAQPWTSKVEVRLLLVYG